MSKHNPKRVKFGIYLPNDNEKWFNVVFTNKVRAHWFAEVNGLNTDEYEVRETYIKLENAQRRVA